MARISKCCLGIFFLLSLNVASAAAPRIHTVSFGKWIAVQMSPESGGAPAGSKPPALKIRPLLIDNTMKEFTFGPPHEFTERLFVVRRAFRINDSLPQEANSSPHWQWQRGGWLLVDRISGRISSINLPDFDALWSNASWYRDYAAYCGISEDGKKVYAVVAQIAQRKPVLKKPLDGASSEPQTSAGDSFCQMTWQRNPSRVTFEAGGAAKQTFAIRGHSADVMPEVEQDEEAAK